MNNEKNCKNEMHRWFILNLLLILSCVNTPFAFAEDRVCNELRTGLSSEVKESIHDLAKLRFDLDQRVARGVDDLLTRAFMSEFIKKQSEVLKVSNLDQDALSSLIRSEVQKIQNQVEQDVVQKGETQKVHSEEAIRAETQVNRIGNLIRPRNCHTQSLLPDGRVVVLGGANKQATLSSIEIIDPKTGEVEMFGDLCEGRAYHCQSILPDGRVLVVGGSADGKILSSIEVINPNTGKVETLGELNEARYLYSLSLLPDGRLLVVGGHCKKGDLSTIEVIQVGRE